MSDPKPSLSWEERRARREERRAKQRAANAGRALKMRAARLASRDDASDVSPRDDLPRLNFGCSGWFYWKWRDLFYPPGMPTKDWFDHYADRFDTVELNAPFYSWPTVANVQSWLRPVRDRTFLYTVKVCELITHVKRLTGTATLIKDFYFIERLLGPHMGCFLFQFPPSFRFTMSRLERLVEQLDPPHRNVVEFRHKSWWNSKTYAAFKKANIIFCSLSAPRLPDELVRTADEIYIRFHGVKQWYRHNYSMDELTTWAARVREAKPRRVWAYFDNDNQAYAPANAISFLRLLKRGKL